MIASKLSLDRWYILVEQRELLAAELRSYYASRLLAASLTYLHTYSSGFATYSSGLLYSSRIVIVNYSERTGIVGIYVIAGNLFFI